MATCKETAQWDFSRFFIKQIGLGVKVASNGFYIFQRLFGSKILQNKSLFNTSRVQFHGNFHGFTTMCEKKRFNLIF